LPWGTAFTTCFDPLKNSFSHARLGVVAGLVYPRLAPGLKNLFTFVRIILAGDRFGCLGILDEFISPIPRLGIMIKPYRRSSSF
jgi:hypothetical protein